MSDREDDRRIGVNSSALFFGESAPVAVGIFFVGTVFLLGWLGVVMQLHLAFWLCPPTCYRRLDLAVWATA